MKTLKISEVFSSAPGCRLRKDGPFSGEEFREDYLKPMLDSIGINESLLIDFDGSFGYASSFLHEVFFAFYEKYPKYGNTRLIVVKSDEEPSLCKEVTDLLYAKILDPVDQRIEGFRKSQERHNELERLKYTSTRA